MCTDNICRFCQEHRTLFQIISPMRQPWPWYVVSKLIHIGRGCHVSNGTMLVNCQVNGRLAASKPGLYSVYKAMHVCTQGSVDRRSTFLNVLHFHHTPRENLCGTMSSTKAMKHVFTLLLQIIVMILHWNVSFSWSLSSHEIRLKCSVFLVCDSTAYASQTINYFQNHLTVKFNIVIVIKNCSIQCHLTSCMGRLHMGTHSYLSLFLSHWVSQWVHTARYTDADTHIRKDIQ